MMLEASVWHRYSAFCIKTGPVLERPCVVSGNNHLSDFWRVVWNNQEPDDPPGPPKRVICQYPTDLFSVILWEKDV